MTDHGSAAISVIIVTHRSAETIGSCLASVRRFLDGIAWEAVIEDNASEDGTLAAIPADPRVTVRVSPVNSGFASACNSAAARASGRNLLFLNPDARLQSFPGELLEAFGQDRSLGAIGPWIEDPNRGSPSWRRRRYEAKLPTIAGEVLRWSEVSRLLVHPVAGSRRPARARRPRVSGSAG